MIDNENQSSSAYENDGQIDNKSGKTHKKVKSKNKEEHLKDESNAILKAE